MRAYYVQVVADNYLRNLVPPPEKIKVHPDWLCGLDEAAFEKGYRALHGVMQTLYQGVVDTPEAFGMMLKANDPPDAKNADYTQSRESFARLPNLLLILGVKGTLLPNLALAIDGGELSDVAKLLKVTKPVELLRILEGQGFEIVGLGKTLKAGAEIAVSYPACPQLTVALKAMAEAQARIRKGNLKLGKDLFYTLYPGLLAGDASKVPKHSLEDFSRSLTAAQQEIVRRLDACIAPYAKGVTKAGGLMRNDWGHVYTLKSNGRVILSLNIVQEGLSAKLNLANIGTYIDQLPPRTEPVRKAILNSGWECGRCQSSCSGGFAFAYEGKQYNKCRCGAFVFDDLQPETLAHCLSLLEKEVEAAAA